MKKVSFYSLFIAAILFVNLVKAQVDRYQREANSNIIPKSFERKGDGSNQIQSLFDVQFKYDLAPLTAMAGVVFTGTEFWVSHWNNDSIYTYSPSGIRTAGFKITGVGTSTSGVRGMTFDGTYIYASVNTTTIQKIDPATKTKVGSITSQAPFVVRGIAWDSTANGGLGGFWVSSFTTSFYLLSMTGAKLDSILLSKHGLQSVYGIAFDPYSAGGPYIWAFDQGVNGDGGILVRISRATGFPTVVNYDTNWDIGSGSGLAGGLAITDRYSPAGKTIIGVMQQDVLLFGYELNDPPPFDASADSIFFSPAYTQIPRFEVTPFNWTVKAKSRGSNSINDLATTFTLNNGITNVFSPPVSHNINVPSGGTVQNSFGPYSPGKGAYTAQAIVNTGSQADGSTKNDTLRINFNVTDGTMAKDNGHVTGELGFGGGGGGTMGQIFELAAPAFLNSVTFLCRHPTAGDSTNAVVYSFNASGPTNLLYITSTYVFTANDAAKGVTLTLPLISPQVLPAGTYFVGVKENANDLTLGTTNFNFQPNTTWADFYGPWAPLESYGYYKTLFIRLNLLEHFNTINGSCFLDINKNGIKDNGEQGFKNITVASQSSSGSFATLTYPSGNFINFSPDTGSITTTLPNIKYYNYSPPQHISSFNSYFNIDSIDFALRPISGIQDLRISLISKNIPRPGFNSTYRIVYSNVGTDTISNNVYFIKDSRLTLISSVPTYVGVNGDSVRWAYTNLLPNETRYIDVTLRIAPPPTVNIGDYLTSKCVIEPVSLDTVPADNYACVCEELVRGSLDPNDKTMLKGQDFTTLQVAGGDYLTYLIRFQNTGSDTAFSIVVIDELDNKLDGTSFEMISASHNYTVSIENNGFIKWTFSNILLPDSNINEPGSHGYVAYRVKAKSNVTAGNVIKNAANIFFDYNLPVATNVAVTDVVFPLLIPDVNNPLKDILLFPNPTENLVTVSYFLQDQKDVRVQLYNLYGQQVKEIYYLEQTSGNHEIVFDMKNFSEGIYFVRVQRGEGIDVVKMVKMK